MDELMNLDPESSFYDVSLDTDIKFNILEKFPTLRPKEVARISLIAFDNNNTPQMKLSSSFWVELAENNKFGFAAPKNKELLAKIIRQYGEPRLRFTTIVLKYSTDDNGQINRDEQGNCKYNFFVWQFSTDKFQVLKRRHAEWNLYQRDLIVELDGKSDVKYQNFDIQPAQNCEWANHPEAVSIVEQAKALYERGIGKYLPREMTDDEIMIRLGWADAKAVANPVNPFGNAVAQSNSPQAQITQQAGSTTADNPFNKIVKPS